MATKGARKYFNTFYLFAILWICIACCMSQKVPKNDSKNAVGQSKQTPTVKRGIVRQKLGFFGTIFHLILEQVNDTKSAYNQINDLVNNQFADDKDLATPPPTVNGTTQAPRISRAEFLKILDRNLKGLARLRNLEWREAKKDSRVNIKKYKEELFSGKEHRNGG